MIKNLKIFLLIFLFFVNKYIDAYTWILEGNWEYFYIIDRNDHSYFKNVSNSQEIIKDLGDGRIIIKNKTIFNTLIQNELYPINYQNIDEKYLKPYYDDENKNKFVSDLAYKIIGDAKTVDEVVKRIAYWIRENIMYSLNAASDPVNVIKSKRAYCEGYGNLASHLLRSVGIPARSIICYIPPLCGWGNNRGGYHAYIEFYYPQQGWLCIDPQSSLYYADPFHINFYPYNAGSFKELTRNDDTYIIDYTEEPKAWLTYFTAGLNEIKHPVFIFKIRDINGRYINDDLPVNTNSLNESFSTYQSRKIYNGWGFQARICSKYIWARNSRESKYCSLILKDQLYKDLKISETLSVELKSALFIKKFKFDGVCKYFFEADFLNDDDIKKIIFMDENDTALINTWVKVIIGKKTYTLLTDEKGRIFLKIDDKNISVIFNEKKYQVSFNKNNVIRIPKKKTVKDPVSDYIKKNNIDVNKPALLCALYDEAGVVSMKAFDSVKLFSDNKTFLELKPQYPGIIYHDDFKLNTDYLLLLNYDNKYIKRIIRFEENKMIAVNISINEEYKKIKISKLLTNTSYLYEYFNGKIIDYKIKNDEIFISFPYGEYYFADNNNYKKLQIINTNENNTEYFYDPGSINIDDYIKIRKNIFKENFLLIGYIAPVPLRLSYTELYDFIINKITDEGDKNLIVESYELIKNHFYQYRLKDNINNERREKILKILNYVDYYSGRLRNTAIFFIDKKTGIISNHKIEEDGFFNIKNIEKNTDYLLYFLQDDLLLIKNIKIENTGIYKLVISNIDSQNIIDCKTGNSKYYFNKAPFYWILPFNKNNELYFNYIELHPFNLDGIFNVFYDTGEYYFAREKKFEEIIILNNTENYYKLDKFINKDDLNNELLRLKKNY